jgi:hypothetical protein
MKPTDDFTGKTGGTVKTCIRCRNNARDYKIKNKENHAMSCKKWRAKNPDYEKSRVRTDNRDRKAYMKEYGLRRKAEKERLKGLPVVESV